MKLRGAGRILRPNKDIDSLSSLGGPNLTNRVAIEIHPIEGRYSLTQKTEFMKKATEAIVGILGCNQEEVVVSFLEYKLENVSRGGIPFSQRG